MASDVTYLVFEGDLGDLSSIHSAVGVVARQHAIADLLVDVVVRELPDGSGILTVLDFSAPRDVASRVPVGEIARLASERHPRPVLSTMIADHSAVGDFQLWSRGTAVAREDEGYLDVSVRGVERLLGRTLVAPADDEAEYGRDVALIGPLFTDWGEGSNVRSHGRFWLVRNAELLARPWKTEEEPDFEFCHFPMVLPTQLLPKTRVRELVARAFPIQSPEALPSLRLELAEDAWLTIGDLLVDRRMPYETYLAAVRIVDGHKTSEKEIRLRLPIRQDAQGKAGALRVQGVAWSPDLGASLAETCSRFGEWQDRVLARLEETLAELAAGARERIGLWASLDGEGPVPDEVLPDVDWRHGSVLDSTYGALRSSTCPPPWLREVLLLLRQGIDGVFAEGDFDTLVKLIRFGGALGVFTINRDELNGTPGSADQRARFILVRRGRRVDLDVARSEPEQFSATMKLPELGVWLDAMLLRDPITALVVAMDAGPLPVMLWAQAFARSVETVERAWEVSEDGEAMLELLRRVGASDPAAEAIASGLRRQADARFLPPGPLQERGPAATVSAAQRAAFERARKEATMAIAEALRVNASPTYADVLAAVFER